MGVSGRVRNASNSDYIFGIRFIAKNKLEDYGGRPDLRWGHRRWLDILARHSRTYVQVS